MTNLPPWVPPPVKPVQASFDPGRHGQPGYNSLPVRVLRYLLNNFPATSNELAKQFNADTRRMREALHKLYKAGAAGHSGKRREYLWYAVGGEDKYTRRAKQVPKEKKAPVAEEPKYQRTWFDV